MNPYLLMVVLYLALALLSALDSSLISYEILPFFNGLRWLRVHLITLGALTEAIFGILPVLAAARSGRSKPAFRWDIWLSLNAGILILLAGIPLMSYPLILTGGTLIFIATALLMKMLKDLNPITSKAARSSGYGRWFYITGLAYLLLGIIVGSGLWFGWGEALKIAVPIEVHIHANNWGFMSLVFAGLIVDLFPKFTGRSLAWPSSIKHIYWMMSLGALGLVLGPWIPSNWVSVPGLVLHMAATIWLLVNMMKSIKGTEEARQPGIWHVITSYAWQLAPVFIAPLIILKVPGFPGAGIESTAPQALIYGWVLQFGYALIPFLLSRAFYGEKEARLGGSWYSLAAIHLGGIFLWASIFIEPYRQVLHGTAYILWVLSMLPILRQVWNIFRSGVRSFEQREDGSSTDLLSRV